LLENRNNNHNHFQQQYIKKSLTNNLKAPIRK